MCYSQNFSELQDVNSQLQVIKSELHDINSKLREIVRIARYKHESEKKSELRDLHNFLTIVNLHLAISTLYFEIMREVVRNKSEFWDKKSQLTFFFLFSWRNRLPYVCAEITSYLNIATEFMVQF